MEVQIRLTSRADGSRFTGYFPPRSMTPIVEYLLLAHAVHNGATGELRARVEPATVRGDDEVIAFAVYADDRPETLGVIRRDCELVAEAINDVWAEVVEAYGRPDSEVADYRLAACDAAPEDVEAAGIRVIGERPSPWRHAMKTPPVRPIALGEGAIVGKPTGAIARVFAASVLQHLLDFLTEDLANERMAALHGELAITPTDGGDLLPYVLYDGISPLDATATSHSVHVGAEAQGGASGRPVAAICHSHPAIIDPELDEDEDELRWGLTIPSAVDLAQLRRGLPHVHQATIIASLPSEAGEPVPLTFYGYSARFVREERVCEGSVS